MDFFSKLGETISATGKDVSKKAKDLTGLAKLNMDVRAKEEYILGQYEEIGRQYYELHKEDPEPIFDEMPLIKEALEEMEALKHEIADLKGLKKCPSCGTVLDIDDVFCNQCGTEYDSVVKEVVSVVVEAPAATEE